MSQTNGWCLLIFWSKGILARAGRGCTCRRLKQISAQHDINLVWFLTFFVSIYDLMNTRRKEMRNQARFTSFWLECTNFLRYNTLIRTRFLEFILWVKFVVPCWGRFLTQILTYCTFNFNLETAFIGPSSETPAHWINYSVYGEIRNKSHYWQGN